MVRYMMEMYVCTVCGYVYYPEIGDAAHDIPPRTPFERLPESWVCPRCRAAKSKFLKKG